MPSAFHKAQINKIAASLNRPRQPRRWEREFFPNPKTEEPAFEIRSFVPLSPQSSLTTNQGWEYQEDGFSYSNRPK